MSNNWRNPPRTITVDPAPIAKVLGIALIIFVVIVVFSTSAYISGSATFHMGIEER